MNTVKYVEIDIKASGFGCVNTNGNINPKTGKDTSEDGYKNKVYPKSRGGKLYVSANSIRAHLFNTDARGIMLAGVAGFRDSGQDGALSIPAKEIPEISQRFASSFLGMLRGYMLTEKGGEAVKRDSALMITDFVNHSDVPPNETEVMVNHLALTAEGKKDNNSLFYAQTWGDTLYHAKAVIHIENLQFISSDSRLGHKSVDFGINPKKKDVHAEIEAFKDKLVSNICVLGKHHDLPTEDVNAEFGLFNRKGTLFGFPEEGFMLNNQAVHILVTEMLSRIKNLEILKSKSFLKVDDIDVGYSYNLDKYLDELDGQPIPYHQFYEKFTEV